MTIDDRGRRAAAGLHRSVRTQVQPEAALTEIGSRRGHRTPIGPGGWSRVAVPAAAVLLLVGLVGVAVLHDRNASQRVRTDNDRQAQRDRRIENALPASPIDGKESLRLPVLVNPQSGLRDGQTITAYGRGFQPEEQVGVVMCSSEADTVSGGVAGCDLGDKGTFNRVTYTAAGPEGVARVEVKVRRFIETPGFGRIDCFSSAERCLVAMGAVADYDRSGGSYIRFAGSPPFPVPSTTAQPTTGLADGERVVVTGRDIIPGRTVVAQQCVDGDRCVAGEFGKVALDGTIALAVTVRSTFDEGRGPVTCRDRCTVRIGGVGTKGASSAPTPPSVRISFDPDAATVTSVATTTSSAPPTTDPATTVPPAPVSPSTGPPSSVLDLPPTTSCQGGQSGCPGQPPVPSTIPSTSTTGP